MTTTGMLAMNGDFLGRLDAEANFVAADVHDGHDDVVANDNAFVTLSG